MKHQSSMLKKIFICIVFLHMSSITYSQMNTEYNEWVNKAMTFYEEKQFQQSGEAFSKAFAFLGGKADPDDIYNAACSWSMAGNADSAFYQLNRLAQNGFTDCYHMVVDDDLVNLHKDSRWVSLCNLIKENKEISEANLNKPLVAILDTILEDDQGYRSKLMKMIKEYGSTSNKVSELWKIIYKNDSINLIKVENILDKFGWLGSDVIGDGGNSTLFLVIQHSNIKVQEKYLPMMRDAAKNHKANPSDLALLEDRVALGEGKKQIYGSQIRGDNSGHFWVSPLEDPDNVDKRRALVGLPPLEDYVQQWNIKWNASEYKKELPEIEKKERAQ